MQLLLLPWIIDMLKSCSFVFLLAVIMSVVGCGASTSSAVDDLKIIQKQTGIESITGLLIEYYDEGNTGLRLTTVVDGKQLTYSVDQDHNATESSGYDVYGPQIQLSAIDVSALTERVVSAASADCELPRLILNTTPGGEQMIAMDCYTAERSQPIYRKGSATLGGVSVPDSFDVSDPAQLSEARQYYEKFFGTDRISRLEVGVETTNIKIAGVQATDFSGAPCELHSEETVKSGPPYFAECLVAEEVSPSFSLADYSPDEIAGVWQTLVNRGAQREEILGVDFYLGSDGHLSWSAGLSNPFAMEQSLTQGDIQPL